MNIMEAIYGRRSVRNYQEEAVPKEVLNKLLEAAVMAPSASNAQPWAFAVFQDRDLLKNFSDRAKSYFLDFMKDKPDPHGYQAKLSNPRYNMFYNANTLVIIYAISDKHPAVGDCCLAAQNLMLAAHAQELGTCWIGFATPFLDSAEFKEEMNIPQAYKAVAPIIAGYPQKYSSSFSRKPAQVLAWK